MLNKQGWRRIPLWGVWDNRTPLNNPHKGWYLHYFDNCIDKYFDPKDPYDPLEDFPCMNHVYLRLAWSYLEPEEGRYNWELIDRVMRHYFKHDRRAALRISCKETDEAQAYATPEWVVRAGAHGEMIGSKRHGRTFEPDYGDPIFLEKFGNFLYALAERYDGAPFLEYVDIGSMGEWGEGHTEGSSERVWPIEVMKEHVDMHTRAFKKTHVLANYDMVALRRTYDGTEEELQRYMVESGCGARADSGCVGFYEDRYGLSSMHLPNLFQAYWRERPIDLELGHYGGVKRGGAFNDGYTMLAAVQEIHATYGGFHGYAREFLGDWPRYAGMMGNYLGYWYFPQALYLPERIRAGERSSMGMIWENRGVAPAYNGYKLYAKLTNAQSGERTLIHLREADNRRWLKNEPREEIYSLRTDSNMAPGEYHVSIGLFEEQDMDARMPEGYGWAKEYPFPGRPIQLALRADVCGEPDGFYRLGKIDVLPYEAMPYRDVAIVQSLWPGHPKDQKSL